MFDKWDLPEMNSLGADLAFDVDTFHMAKLLRRTTRLVVINFPSWLSKAVRTASSLLSSRGGGGCFLSLCEAGRLGELGTRWKKMQPQHDFMT